MTRPNVPIPIVRAILYRDASFVRSTGGGVSVAGAEERRFGGIFFLLSLAVGMRDELELEGSNECLEIKGSVSAKNARNVELST